MDGAVIYFKLNGNSNDSSGNGFNGTDTTITYTNSGKMGGAAQFNDSVDNKSKIDYGKGTIRDNIVHLTVMAWVYIHSFVTSTGGNRRLYTKGLANAGQDIYLNSAGNMTFVRGWTGNNGRWRSSTNLSLNTWTHIALVYDGSATGNIPTWYINGKADTTTTSTSPTIALDDDSTITGQVGNINGYDRGFDGIIDEFVMYNNDATGVVAPKTAAEIKAYYDRTKQKYNTQVI